MGLSRDVVKAVVELVNGESVEQSDGIDVSDFSTVDPFIAGILWLDDGQIVVSKGV